VIPIFSSVIAFAPHRKLRKPAEKAHIASQYAPSQNFFCESELQHYSNHQVDGMLQIVRHRTSEGFGERAKTLERRVVLDVLRLSGWSRLLGRGA
jgi:hypothetical protein